MKGELTKHEVKLYMVFDQSEIVQPKIGKTNKFYNVIGKEYLNLFQTKQIQHLGFFLMVLKVMNVNNTYQVPFLNN